MKTGKTVHKVQAYIDKKGYSVHQFAKIANLPQSTLYALLETQRTPQRRTAIKICRATAGEITLEDLGVE